MSELTVTTYQRQIADVTQDIRRKTGEFLATAIEIGRMLFEAKSMVEPGGWSKYIEEELPFSHSWANNYMKLYTEFGSDQTSLFGNSQTFMKLRPTQALEVLRLPEAEREAFVESHDVEEMSTRQLRQAVQDQLDEEKRRREKVEKDLESAQAALRDANQNVIDMQQQLSAAKSSEGAWQKEFDKLEAEKYLAETGEKNAIKKVEVLEKQLKEARAKEKTVRAELKQAREHPEVPESVMEALRKEAEADAAQQATADIQKQLDTANAALAEANAKVKAAEDKLVAAQNNQKMNDQDLMAVQTLGQQMLAMANSINGHRMKAVIKDENNARAINGFLTHILNELRVSFGIKADALGDGKNA